MLGEIWPRREKRRRLGLKIRQPAFFLFSTFFLVLASAGKLTALERPQSPSQQGEKPISGQPSISIPKQTPAPPSSVRPEQQSNRKFLITVLDENGVAIPSARVILTPPESQAVQRGETDYAGRCEFKDLDPGLYRLRTEKEGFYVTTLNEVRVEEAGSLEVVLNHQQEFVEVVNVVYSPPAIDPAKTAASGSLSSQEIINLPYAVTRDIRYALPLLPGVLQDAIGQVHVNGSSTRQVVDELDGFNITDPATGFFDLRVSVDALRSVEVLSGRYPVEFGKASGGIVSLITGMGADRFRFSGTDFFPSLQNRKGVHLNTWTPRATFSGPLRKGKAWYLEAIDSNYDLNIIKELPAGADRNPVWRISNLAKTQVNATPRNILTASFLVNRFGSEHAGLSRFDPLETTVNLDESAYLFSVKDQAFLSNGVLLELGLGFIQFSSEERPLGSETYVITPDSTRGNFFVTAHANEGRLQGIGNLIFPSVRWYGRHEFKVGTDFDRVTERQSVERRPILILREDGTLSRRVNFVSLPPFARNNFEASAFGQDRWMVSDRWQVDPGLRLDWDEVVRRLGVSPRLASSYMLTRDGNTKLSAGVGFYYDATTLDFIVRPSTGRRFDLFYDPSGQVLVRPPVETTFGVNERELREPRFLNWSVGLERKLARSVYLTTQFARRRGRHGWTFINQGLAGSENFSGQFQLEDARRDRYDLLELSLRRILKGNHVIFASYTRSKARSNAVFNFNLDFPIFSQQSGGPFAWDSPNRFLSWGWLPLPRGFDLGYLLDWRDGYPFFLVNQDQQVVGPMGSIRLPAFLSLNINVERRLRLLGFEWALRVGLDDATNRANPSFLDNNVDSPHFLTFGGSQGRALTARIRLLGKK